MAITRASGLYMYKGRVHNTWLGAKWGGDRVEAGAGEGEGCTYLFLWAILPALWRTKWTPISESEKTRP